jgi:hypothetical protein
VECVLAVRDNELDVGGIEDASSEVAEGQDTRGKALGSHMERNRTRGEPAPEFRRLGTAGNCWGPWAPGTPVDPRRISANVSLQFYNYIRDSQVAPGRA